MRNERQDQQRNAALKTSEYEVGCCGSARLAESIRSAAARERRACDREAVSTHG
jgi:hypothetical protein